MSFGNLRGVWILAMVGLLSVTACSDSSTFNLSPDVEKLTAEQIFQKGEYELSRKRYKEGAVFFSEIERLYPYSEWAKRALIMQAYALHLEPSYEESRAAAQRFIDFYPAEDDAAYAQYLLALSYYDQIDEVGRDQGLTFQALQSLRAVIEGYPDSEYARSAILKFDLAFDHLAGKEMEIGRYYLRRDHYTAAINRFRVVVEDFQTTTHTAEALHRLVEAYLSLGLATEAERIEQVAIYNYPQSVWTERLLELRDNPARELEAGWFERTAESVANIFD